MMPTSTMNNTVQVEPYSYLDTETLFMKVLIIIICYTQIVLATLFNIIALLALRCGDISLDVITRLFLSALSIVNLIVGVAYPFMYSFIFIDHASTSYTRPKQFFTMFCRTFQSLFTAPLVLALLIITCINFNKYLLISRPLTYHLYVTPLRAKVAIAVAVVLAICYSMIFASFPSSPYAQYRIAVCSHHGFGTYHEGQSWLLIEVFILTPIIAMTTAINARMLYITLKLAKRQVVPRPQRSSPPSSIHSAPSFSSSSNTMLSSPASSRSTSPTTPSPPPSTDPTSFPVLPGSPIQDVGSPTHPLSPAIATPLISRAQSPTSLNDLNPKSNASNSPLPPPSHPQPRRGIQAVYDTPDAPQRKKSSHQSKQSTARYNLKRSDFKAIRTITVITATFYIIWVPLIINDIMKSRGESIKGFMTAAKLILMASTWWNTLLCIATDRKFRNHVVCCIRRLVSCRKCTKNTKLQKF